MDRGRKATVRTVCIAVAFVLICTVYFARMVSLAANKDTDTAVTDTYERRETIQAVRGEIYDRNGNKLVYNSYTYDMVFDYDAMAATQLERNYAILRAVEIIDGTDSRSHLTESSFPFDGTYPYYTYSAEAKDMESSIYYRLLKRIAENELETESDRKKNELTASYLYEFYTDHPEKFPTEKEIVDLYVEKYQLDAANEDGTPLFSDIERDTVIRMRYDMEVNDFSIYTQYTVATDLDIAFISAIKEAGIAGADFTVQTERKYAYPGYASHILGQTGKIPAESWSEYKELGYGMNDIVGLSGCEEAFEKYLRGEDGVMVIIEDKDGNIIDKRIEKQAAAGNDVYLTIDIELQIAAEDALRENVAIIGDARAGAVTAVDPDNGEVLVLASYPTYNLETYNKDYSNLVGDPANPLYNRVLSGLYTPGSTFKVGIAAAGISSGIVSASTYLRCDAIYTYYDDYQPKCWYYPHSHGDVNAAYAVQVSCNCYFYELGRLMGIESMNEYCLAYGLGQYTGIELSEKKGILAGPDYRDENGLSGWTAGNTIAAAIGQSDNSFTPLQLASYISTVLNGGTRYSVHLLLEVRAYGTNELVYENQTKVLNTVELTDSAVNAVKQGMGQMVRYDSAVSNYMKNVPVAVGGKSGTAQRGTGANDNRLFVCAAPYNDPEIVISTVIEPDDSLPKDNAHGSSYASYTSAKILEKYYAK